MSKQPFDPAKFIDEIEALGAELRAPVSTDGTAVFQGFLTNWRDGANHARIHERMDALNALPREQRVAVANYLNQRGR